MKCSYHPATDSSELCRTCNKPLCPQCAHQIKGRFYCQDCLVRGAEWAAAVKDLRVPADSPKRAAVCALIPGMGAVYNNEYLKAITFFAVFAALVTMGDNVHAVFGFGAFAFLVFTMFDSYRVAEAKTRARVEGAPPAKQTHPDKTVVGWGIFLILLGILFMLQNVISYYFLHRMWPLVFIFLGAYLVYRYLRDPAGAESAPAPPLTESKDSL
jgi:uncharacterized integral membrane protein